MSSAVAETRNRLDNSVNFKDEREIKVENVETNLLGVLASHCSFRERHLIHSLSSVVSFAFGKPAQSYLPMPKGNSCVL